METAANRYPLPRYIRLSTGKVLCLICTKELSDRAARFHILRCKARAATGEVVDGRRQEVAAP